MLPFPSCLSHYCWSPVVCPLYGVRMRGLFRQVYSRLSHFFRPKQLVLVGTKAFVVDKTVTAVDQNKLFWFLGQSSSFIRTRFSNRKVKGNNGYTDRCVLPSRHQRGLFQTIHTKRLSVSMLCPCEGFCKTSLMACCWSLVAYSSFNQFHRRPQSSMISSRTRRWVMAPAQSCQ